MAEKEPRYKTVEDLERELEELRAQLEEANDTIEAIRTGQVDALVVQNDNGHQLYTLRSADHTYRVFIEKMTEGAITLDASGLILYCNSRFAAMVGMPLSHVIGLPFERFIAPENKEQYKRLFTQCWLGDCKGEVVLQSGENQTPVQLSLTTLELEEGTSLSIILTDLTAHKAAQQQLHQNNKQLEDLNRALETSNHDLQQFASVASHDLQEPVRKIQIFSSLMSEHQAELAPDLKKYLDKIVRASGRMRTLIIDILNYSRFSANDQLQECIHLLDIIDELKEDFELIITEKKAQLVVGPLPCIVVNKGLIRQVFQNIVSNALKFSKPAQAPVITISSKQIREKSFDSPEDTTGRYWLISIKDNGIGFDEKYLNHIFTLFERLNSKDAYEGSGIGLAIAKKIIDKHNGLITATSSEGEGAEFKIILPTDPSHP
jgi:PAS domain S-box-containing protein